MNGHERRQGRRLASLLASACAVAATWALATSAFAVATVELSTTNGAPGGNVRLTMSITGQEGDPAFAGAQVDLIIERAQLGIEAQCSASAMECDSGLDCQDVEACVLLSCDKDPRLPAALQVIANSPRFQNVPVPATNKRLRLGIVGPIIPVTTFDDGVVLTCDLNVPGSAALGVQNLSTDRLVVSDENGDVIPSQVVVIPGSIVDAMDLTPTPAASPTPTNIGGTPTSTSTNGVSTPTNTPSRTSTPTGGVVGTPTNTPTGVLPTVTGTPGESATPTPTNGGGGGGGGDGCDCAITPEAHANRGSAAMIWLSLLPIGLLVWRRRAHQF